MFLFLCILFCTIPIFTQASAPTVKQYPYNPIIVPVSPVNNGDECIENIYSQELVHYGDVLLMFYGGWDYTSNLCHDQIFLAYSHDGGMNWRKYPTDTNPSPVLAVGSSVHVNDPSVVFANGQTYMYYTDNNYYTPGNPTDRIYLATSKYITGFQKITEVITNGDPGTWNSMQIGRPAVIYEDGIFKMWYDGNSENGPRCIGFANSTDGIHFVNYPKNPLFCGSGGIDVKKIDGIYYMLQEGQSGSSLASSKDGIQWTQMGLLIPKSGKSFDAFGHVVPSFQLSKNGSLEAIWFGGASVAAWDRNRIAVAYPNGFLAGGGCTDCSGGVSCATLCQLDHNANYGICGNSGSTNPGSCCTCYNDGCQACVNGPADCHQACVGIGHAGGYCQFSGSTDPAKCCTCI